jgi:ubiquinone/menaquinone biosynthesis C-methylase UbiE
MPSGWFGRTVMPIVFDRGNAFLNGFANEIMAVQSDDLVLEIGCGTGKLIKLMANNIESGFIEGIDFSSTMVRIAQRRNKRHITRGTVSIVEANFDENTTEHRGFTKVCSVNTLYFWKNPEHTVQKVIKLLEPGGRFVVAFEDFDQLERRKLDMDVFQPYRKNDVRRLLTGCGFSRACIESKEKRKLFFHCVVATK